MFECKHGDKSYNIITNAMIPLGNNVTLTAVDYFNGLAAGITADEWKSEFLPK